MLDRRVVANISRDRELGIAPPLRRSRIRTATMWDALPQMVSTEALTAAATAHAIEHGLPWRPALARQET